MFVTRAVRVIDLITNLDMSSFEAHNGLTAFINRLEYEVNECRKEQPFVIRVKPSVVKRDEDVDIVDQEQSTDMNVVEEATPESHEPLVSEVKDTSIDGKQNSAF